MRTKLTLRPGQKGTRRLVAEHGDRLVCVRYRYDEHTQKRYKTVELIVEAVDWNGKPGDAVPQGRVSVRVEGYERDLRSRVKAAGGRWDPEQKVWKLPYKTVTDLDLEDRVVTESSAWTQMP